MKEKSLGFIGGGRVTRFILAGLERKEGIPKDVVVSDIDRNALNRLKNKFPNIETMPKRNNTAAGKDVIFIALHPPVIFEVLPTVTDRLKPDAIVISLAPKLTIAKLSELLGGFERIVRMIPNAPSFVNAGYNPVAFSNAISHDEKREILEMLSLLGECPEVNENDLEAYAVTTAMGPTYLWFQLYEILGIAKSFGLSHEKALEGVSKMAAGAARTMMESGLSPEEVMDLIPARPFEDEEANIKKIYRTKLEGIFEKLKG